MFVIQCETLGFESSSVILSVGLQYFDEEKGTIDQSAFVKFSVEDQVKNYKRKINPDAVKWWKTQSKLSKQYSLIPSVEVDKSVVSGIDNLLGFVEQNSKHISEIFWSRGYITPMCINSLFESAGKASFIKHHLWRDMRTAIDLTKETAENGYCEVPDYIINKEHRHIPILSVYADTNMLLFGV